MLCIPIKGRDGYNDAIILILSADNVDRMKRADPIQIETAKTGMKLVSPCLMVCIEENTPEFNRLVNSRDVQGLIKYLTRGFEYRPDLGDHDRGPEKLGGLQ